MARYHTGAYVGSKLKGEASTARRLVSPARWKAICVSLECLPLKQRDMCCELVDK